MKTLYYYIKLLKRETVEYDKQNGFGPWRRWGVDDFYCNTGQFNLILFLQVGRRE